MGTIVYSGQPVKSDAALVDAARDIIIGGLIAVNATDTDQAVTLSVHRADGRVEPLATAAPVEAGTAGPVLNMAWTHHQGILLRAGDSLRGSASAAKAITLLAYE